MKGWQTIIFKLGEETKAQAWYARNKGKYQINEIFVNNCCAAYDYRPLIKY